MTSQGTELALAAYRPRPEREDDFLVFLHEELALLRRRGHVTERRAPVVRAPKGELLVVLEWSSDHAVDDAHADPDVLEIWDRKAELAEDDAIRSRDCGAGSPPAWACIEFRYTTCEQ